MPGLSGAGGAWTSGLKASLGMERGQAEEASGVRLQELYEEVPKPHEMCKPTKQGLLWGQADPRSR